MRDKLIRFMQGRYGVDNFNKFILGAAVVSLVLSMFVRSNILNMLGLLLIVYCYFRMFSRNIQKRYAENQKYLVYKNKVTGFFKNFPYGSGGSKEFHIYKCPNCKQKIRIPRGKGRISITCPKCKTSFIKKS